MTQVKDNPNYFRDRMRRLRESEDPRYACEKCGYRLKSEHAKKIHEGIRH